MAETINTLVTRRSCRKYKPELIEEEKLQEIIKAGMYAPTSMNRQSPIIIAITNKRVRDNLELLNAKVRGMEGKNTFYGAPELLVVLADMNVPAHVYDGSLVMGNLMNAATDLGVGSCWIHGAKEEFETEEGKLLLRTLGVSGNYEGIGHCILGYPDGPMNDPAPRKENYVYYAV